jgi:hypothetical protein
MLKKVPNFVLGSKKSRPPHHLGGAHKRGATYSSHRAPSTYPRGYASGFFSPAASLDNLFEHSVQMRDV